MTAIKQLLDTKGREVLSIGPDDSVYDAIKLMADKNVGSLVVMEDDRMAGIITERDYARNVFLKGRSSPDTSVGDIMERAVICITLDETVEECMVVMTSRSVRHLPVLEENAVVGIVSIGDLVKSIIDGQKFIIEQLETYITR
ncbi:MAG: CBS domain-containing protein [Paracoccaceae bacterium]|jgi:CBS domain-containing protein